MLQQIMKGAVQGYRVLALMVIALLTGLGAPFARAQDRTDDESVFSVDEALSAPDDISSAKRTEARRGGHWVGEIVGTTAIGYDTNVHESPDHFRHPTGGKYSPEEASGFEYLGTALEGLRYFGDKHRMKVDLEVDGRHYWKSVDASPVRAEGTFFYGYRPSRIVSLSVSGSIKYHKDSSTDIDGRKLQRSLAYQAYRLKTSAWIHPSESQTIQISNRAQRRDYEETKSLPSLDWWKYGPRLEYTFEATKSLELQAYGSFVAQNYDEEPANDVAGHELPGYPAEEHFFYGAGTELTWKIVDGLETTLGYDYDRKDDRFEGYESYTSHAGTLDLTWTPRARWQVQSKTLYKSRHYDRYPVAAGNVLHYDEWTETCTIFYRWTKHVSPYLAYEVDVRNSNAAPIQRSYRGYARHVVMLGVSVAY